MLKLFTYIGIGSAVLGAVMALIPLIQSGAYDGESVWAIIAPVLATISAAAPKANIDTVLAQQVVMQAVATIKGYKKSAA